MSTSDKSKALLLGGLVLHVGYGLEASASYWLGQWHEPAGMSPQVGMVLLQLPTGPLKTSCGFMQIREASHEGLAAAIAAAEQRLPRHALHSGGGWQCGQMLKKRAESDSFAAI